MNAATARLFVALPVPGAVTAVLRSLQPAAGPGVRLSRIEDMHVTLHFLGQQQPEAIAESLMSVQARAFRARLGAAGAFALRGGRTVLWVGVEPSAPLLELHAKLGEALASAGFTPEARRYIPHITLARLGPGAPADSEQAFLQQTPVLESPDFECSACALFSSQTRPEGARYRLLATYPLN